eukprot:gene34430-10026_t
MTFLAGWVPLPVFAELAFLRLEEVTGDNIDPAAKKKMAEMRKKKGKARKEKRKDDDDGASSSDKVVSARAIDWAIPAGACAGASANEEASSVFRLHTRPVVFPLLVVLVDTAVVFVPLAALRLAWQAAHRTVLDSTAYTSFWVGCIAILVGYMVVTSEGEHPLLAHFDLEAAHAELSLAKRRLQLAAGGRPGKWAAAVAPYVSPNDAGVLLPCDCGACGTCGTAPRDYGAALCKAWDVGRRQCARRGAPQWCAASFCYVDPAHCTRPHSVSEMLPGLHYSYETCGNLNTYDDNRFASVAVDGAPVRIGLPTAPSSKPGWFYYDSTIGAWDGVYVRFMDRVLRDVLNVSRAQMVKANATAHSRALFTSSFTACVHDVAIGEADLCVAPFMDTTQRRLMSQMSAPIDTDDIVLIIPTDGGVGAAWAKVFQAFTPSLWFSVIGVLAAAAALVSLFERDNSAVFPDRRLRHVLPTSAYLSVISLMSASVAHRPRTLPGHVTAVGLGFFILVVITGYTAQTVSFLLVQNTDVGATDIDDACDGGAGPLLLLRMAQAGGEHCDKRVVGDPILSLPITVPHFAGAFLIFGGAAACALCMWLRLATRAELQDLRRPPPRSAGPGGGDAVDRLRWGSAERAGSGGMGDAMLHDRHMRPPAAPSPQVGHIGVERPYSPPSAAAPPIARPTTPPAQQRASVLRT